MFVKSYGNIFYINKSLEQFQYQFVFSHVPMNVFLIFELRKVSKRTKFSEKLNVKFYVNQLR